MAPKQAKKQLTAAERAELKKILATVKEGIRRWAPIYKHHTWTYHSGGRGAAPAILTVTARDGKCIAWTTEDGFKPTMTDRTLFPNGFMSAVKQLTRIGLVSKEEQKRLEALNRRVFDASCERANRRMTKDLQPRSTTW